MIVFEVTTAEERYTITVANAVGKYGGLVSTFRIGTRWNLVMFHGIFGRVAEIASNWYPEFWRISHFCPISNFATNPVPYHHSFPVQCPIQVED